MPFIIAIISISFIIACGSKITLTFGSVNVYPFDLLIIFSILYSHIWLFKNKALFFRCILVAEIISLSLTIYQKLFNITIPFNIIIPLIFLIFHSYKFKIFNKNNLLFQVVVLNFMYILIQTIKAIFLVNSESAINDARGSLLIWGTISMLFFIMKEKKQKTIEKILYSTLLLYAGSSILLLILTFFGIIEIRSIGVVSRYLSAGESFVLSVSSVYILNKIVVDNKNKGKLLFLFFTMAIGVLLTFHRSVWIATFAGYSSLLILKGKRGFKLIVFCLLLVILVLPFIPNEVFHDLNVSTEDALNYKDGNTASWRVDGWIQLIETASRIAPITGMGFGIPMTRVLKDGDSYIEWDVSAHNQFVDTYFTVGLLGLLLYVSLYILLIIKCLKYNKNMDYSSPFALIITFFFYFISYSALPLFGIVFGLLCAYLDSNQNQQTIFIDSKRKTYEITSTLTR